MKQLSIVACLGMAVSVIGVTGCVADDEGETTDELAGTPDTPPVFLDQGWSDSTRDSFYRTTQGSRMLPYSWFLALEQADSKQKFKAPSNMRRMGFLVDGITASNPDELPVGFAKDEHPTRGAAIGLTCAACHTGELEYQGTRIRVDGGQSFGDLETLQKGILASLQATLADSAKFKRFGDAVLGTGASSTARATLRTQVESMRDWWTGRVARTSGQSPHGPTRTDAFTIIGNEVVCNLLGIPENCTPGIAPTQFPFLWNTPDFEWAQYNSSVHSPIGRNVGEVTGVYAESSLAADGTVVSTANLTNLHSLELWLRSLQSPAWPEELLGPIDLELAAEGEAIYTTACAGCHTLDPQPRTAPNIYGATFAKVDFSTPLSALGTDSTAALTFATRRAYPGPWTPIMQAQGLIGPDGKVPAVALLSVSGSMIIQRFFAINGFTDLQKLQYLSFRESRSATIAQLTTYKARPLNGIAFTAPFLHNGSVPSIYQLLLPPAQRVKQFYVGNKEFDPGDLGYSTEQVSNAMLFDTTLLGNGNGGHVYGTDLDDAQRMALIEYLKTL
jgi:mono/diheme cytochrome c family protein